ncbi:glycosyltransferase family 2 protein [Imperialibacter roseus]|uniref:Glycosyltransferase family 2 protein n=1 Tax=Imperialibacter roseus TaxID=1324217 RepID=A0ABZ0IMN4_9BACT|nr:glycosyltransferase family 2 protein [Imperialibacter roseus]WOK06289.1 glycosyltransferase family 2 protein [Imperialibacter roseus]
MMYKVSIITVNLNNGPGLERTIKSVLSQTFSDFEYLVIDGASTDSSSEVLSRYSNRIDYWVSEPDKGVYQAMNKGIRASSGDYVWFLNSGDTFADTCALEKMMAACNGEDILYGDLMLQEGKKMWRKNYPDKVRLSHLLFEALPHPAMMAKRALLIELKGFDESLRIVADWAFYTLAIFKNNASYKHLAEPLSLFYFDGLSSKVENQELIENEKRKVLDNHFHNLLQEMEDLIKLNAVRDRLNQSKTLRLLNAFRILKMTDIL